MVKNVVNVRRRYDYNYGGVHHVYPKEVCDRRTDGIVGDTAEEIFLKYYELNRELRYINDEHWEWEKQEDEKAYKSWYKSLPEEKKFSMYYGGSVVD